MPTALAWLDLCSQRDRGTVQLLKRAIDNPSLMNSDIVDVMEPPFPAVATTDPVREAVELLSGEGQALTVTEGGRPVGIVTRAQQVFASFKTTTT